MADQQHPETKKVGITRRDILTGQLRAAVAREVPKDRRIKAAEAAAIENGRWGR